jgi:hypothetical protein
MGKLSEIFSMSKQERMGAWAIAALIVILLTVVFIERKCSSDNGTDAKAQKELNEYINKTDDIKVGEKKKAKTSTSKNKTKAKNTNSSAKKSGTKSTAKTTKKDSGKSTSQKTKKKTNTNKKNAPKKKSSGASRLVEPLPQF